MGQFLTQLGHKTSWLLECQKHIVLLDLFIMACMPNLMLLLSLLCRWFHVCTICCYISARKIEIILDEYQPSSYKNAGVHVRACVRVRCVRCVRCVFVSL